jgi:DNA-directed RNA polymerase I, II, and III subunit RPABC2
MSKNIKDVPRLDEEDQEDDDVESVYDDADVDADVDDRDQKPSTEDDDDDEEEDDGADRVAPPRRHHIYHQVPDSTEIKIVAPGRRTTSEYMTIYEYSMVVGTRATHISEGSILYTDPEGLFDPRDIAKKEINENKCPLSITRKVSPSMIEVWEVNEMIKPQV